MSTTGRPFLRRGPSGPLAVSQGGIVQVGYDQAEKSQSLTDSSSYAEVIPRDASDPLQVELPEVQAGNYIEVDFSLHVANNTGGNGTITAAPVVSFVASPTYPDDFFLVNNAVAENSGPSNPDTAIVGVRGLACFAVPDSVFDTATVTVRLAYNVNGPGFSLFGTDSAATDPCTTLKVTEISGDVVTQPGPTTLVPIV